MSAAICRSCPPAAPGSHEIDVDAGTGRVEKRPLPGDADLGVHWLSDTLESIFVAVGLVAALWAALGTRIEHEAAARATDGAAVS